MKPSGPGRFVHLAKSWLFSRQISSSEKGGSTGPWDQHAAVAIATPVLEINHRTAVRPPPRASSVFTTTAQGLLRKWCSSIWPSRCLSLPLNNMFEHKVAAEVILRPSDLFVFFSLVICNLVFAFAMTVAIRKGRWAFQFLRSVQRIMTSLAFK